VHKTCTSGVMSCPSSFSCHIRKLASTWPELRGLVDQLACCKSFFVQELACKVAHKKLEVSSFTNNCVASVLIIFNHAWNLLMCMNWICNKLAAVHLAIYFKCIDIGYIILLWWCDRIHRHSQGQGCMFTLTSKEYANLCSKTNVYGVFHD